MEASIQWMRAAVVAALFFFFAASSSQAVVIWDEAVDGDLNDAGTPATAPSDFNLLAGTSSIKGTLPSSDRDFVTIFVPEDHEFTGLVLSAYVSTDNTSFIGMKAGETIIVNTTNPSGLTGYAHFGDGEGGPENLGEDILDDICAGAGAMGCSAPLASGAYTFWIQQASTFATSFQFDFIIEAIEEPDPILIGDYNGDNKVSAADYTVWRDHFGADSLTNRDPDNEGTVGDDDFESWKEHYGDVPEGSGAGATSIPEPSSVVLAVLAAVYLGACRLRWRN